MPGIGAIKWDSQAQGKISFEKSGVVGNQVGAFLILDAGFDSLKKAWPLE